MQYNRDRCDICKKDIHRASYTRPLKSKEHLQNMTQIKVKVLREYPTKRNVKEESKVPDFDTNVENHYFFTDKILKIAYDINIENHHDKNAKSQITITSKFDNLGIDIYHIDKIMNEMIINMLN